LRYKAHNPFPLAPTPQQEAVVRSVKEKEAMAISDWLTVEVKIPERFAAEYVEKLDAEGYSRLQFLLDAGLTRDSILAIGVKRGEGESLFSLFLGAAVESHIRCWTGSYSIDFPCMLLETSSDGS
jgi:hypothetical protein